MLQDKLYYIIAKLLKRLFGVGVMALSLVVVIALFSFDANDPSFNSFSTSNEVHNWMGSFGAHSADLLFQLIGLSSFFLCFLFFVIGSKLASTQEQKSMIPKLILTPFAILCLSLFFATLPQPSWWEFDSLGGFDGSYILSRLTDFPYSLVVFGSLVFSIILVSIIVDITFDDWVYFIRYAIAMTAFIMRQFSKELLKLPELKDALLAKFVKDSRVSVSVTNKKTVRKTKARVVEEERVEEESPEELKKQLRNSTKIKKFKNGSKYQIPSTDLLMDRSAENKDKKLSKDVVDEQSKNLVKVLEDFGVYGTSLGGKVGPVITLHEFEPAPGTKASRVISLSDDIARSMSAVSARIAVVPGKTSIGIELPNPKREMIFLREMIESKAYAYCQHALPMIIGKDIGGEAVVVDLAKMPHLLIAGTTGSGKSVGLNVMILSLLFKLRPDECKFIMIDPKMLELSIYDGIPHLLSPVITDPSKAIISLKWVVAEMEERYRLMSSLAVRNIYGYNEKVEKAILNGEKMSKKVQTGYDPTTGKPIVEELEFEAKKLPFIVVIVDELADLMLVAGKEIESSIQRLAQMARAAGIHIIMATQRPSVDVITGVIKANFPTRISFQVTSRIDSRTILGTQGAEQLLGQGDMIYMSGGSKMTRAHGPFCSDTEIENIVNFIKSQDLSEFEEDEISFEESVIMNQSSLMHESDVDSKENDLYSQAVMIVKRDKKTSISYIQRQLRIGYNRAATIIEKMEEDGILTAPSPSGKREIIE